MSKSGKFFWGLVIGVIVVVGVVNYAKFMAKTAFEAVDKKIEVRLQEVNGQRLTQKQMDANDRAFKKLIGLNK